jgi:sialidase-1
MKAQHLVVYREADRYCSFPHVVYLPNGSLAVTFRRASKFSADAAKRGLATHHDPDSSIEMVESPDEGMTWPRERLRTVYKSRYGVNDPSFTVLADGTLLNRFVALEIKRTCEVLTPPAKIFSHRADHGLVASVVGNLIVQSRDSGDTWQEVGVADVPAIGPSCSRDPIVEMPDGAWLMPVYTGAPQRSDIAWVIRSFDRGRTWCEPIRIMSDEAGRFSQLQGINYNETSLLHLGNGEMLAMVRADVSFHTEEEFMPVGGVGDLCTARSFDGGLSWTAPRRTGIWGQPGSLLALRDGRLLCTYGYRRKPFGVRCCVSRDRGANWDVEGEIVLRDDSPTWDCGYPFTIELNGGELFTVYYIVDGDGSRCVAATRWTLA